MEPGRSLWSWVETSGFPSKHVFCIFWISPPLRSGDLGLGQQFRFWDANVVGLWP